MKINAAESTRSNILEVTSSSELRKKLIAAGAAGALALGMAACSSGGEKADAISEPVPQSTEMVVEAPETPLYTETLPQGEELREMFYIPSGLSDEELARTYLQRLDSWNNFAATDEMSAQRKADYSVNFDELRKTVTGNAAADIIPALFSESFIQDNQDWLDKITDENQKIILVRNATMPGATPQDKEPYRVWREFDSVESQSEGADMFGDPGRYSPEGVGVTMYSTYYDNSNLNRAGELRGNAEEKLYLGEKVKTQIRFVDGGDGRMYIDDIVAEIVTEDAQ